VSAKNAADYGEWAAETIVTPEGSMYIATKSQTGYQGLFLSHD